MSAARSGSEIENALIDRHCSDERPCPLERLLQRSRTLAGPRDRAVKERDIASCLCVALP